MSSSSETSKRMLTLRTSSGELLKIEEEAATRFATIKNMVEDGFADSVIPVPNVDGKVLAMLLKWCEKHNDERDEEKLRNWDATFVRDLDTVLLCHLIKAADYLGGADLLDLLAEKAASMIRGRTVEQIRQRFGIKNDLTPEEEEAIHSKNRWAFAN